MQTVAPNPMFNNLQQAQYSAPVGVQPAFSPSINLQPQIQGLQTVQAGQTAQLQGVSQNVQAPANANVQKKGGILNSMLDIGKTVAGGVAVGAVSGGLVSLLPSDDTDLMAASLHDTILEAAMKSDTLPDDLKNASEPFNMAKELMKAQEGYNQIKTKEILTSAQLKLATALDDDSIKSTMSELAEILKGTGIDIADIPADVASNSNALEALKTDTLLRITEAINKNTSSLDDAAKNAAIDNILNAKNTFIESIKKFIKEAPAGDGLVSSAKSQAKIASTTHLMGKAISFAVLIALITKAFDIMRPKKDKENTKTSSAPAVQSGAQNVQQTGNVWNMFSQSAAQGPLAQNNFNKFMTLG